MDAFHRRNPEKSIPQQTSSNGHRERLNVATSPGATFRQGNYVGSQDGSIKDAVPKSSRLLK
jgi:hypothetical protein